MLSMGNTTPSTRHHRIRARRREPRVCVKLGIAVLGWCRKVGLIAGKSPMMVEYSGEQRLRAVRLYKLGDRRSISVINLGIRSGRHRGDGTSG